MKVVIEIYVSILILCITALMCIGFISADVQVAQARDSYASYMQQIRDSNYSEFIIDECKASALANGYELTVILYEDGAGNRSCDATLKYEYRIAILNVENVKYIRGYSS